MRILKKIEIELVKPKFRKMVREAWKRGENVPYSVILLSEGPITQSDIDLAKRIVKRHKLKLENANKKLCNRCLEG